MVSAWYYNEDDKSDPRMPHKFSPVQEISLEKLASVGVLHWHFNPESELDKVQELMKTRKYNNSDQITISKEKLPNYEEKLKIFFTEHMHDDEEIRYIMEGSGYFDIRDVDDRWMRIQCDTGDMIVLPAGAYHRFILDHTNYLKAMRLFKEDVNWTPLNREDPTTEDHHIRQDYLTSLKDKTVITSKHDADEEDEEDSATSKKLKTDAHHEKLDVLVASQDEVAVAAE
ncbi:N-terminal acetyltransferase A complex catalytic subunit ard1 [Kappamyces sp. JEL0680]|nr:N-terminal acetyltransferase A complex catalytic subunit ard1 [Kappamyces sp. JEL0680]